MKYETRTILIHMMVNHMYTWIHVTQWQTHSSQSTSLALVYTSLGLKSQHRASLPILH